MSCVLYYTRIIYTTINIRLENSIGFFLRTRWIPNFKLIFHVKVFFNVRLNVISSRIRFLYKYAFINFITIIIWARTITKIINWRLLYQHTVFKYDHINAFFQLNRKNISNKNRIILNLYLEFYNFDILLV